jgi:hypothetical protein
MQSNSTEISSDVKGEISHLILLPFFDMIFEKENSYEVSTPYRHAL